MAIDLKSMSRKELTALRGRIDTALKRMEKADKKKALEAARQAAAKHGFSLSDLTGGPVGKKRGPKPKASAPKYRHPDDASVTWTGKGRRPDWIKAGLAAGKSLEDFAI